MGEPLVDRDVVLKQLEEVLSSAVFRRAERSSVLLRFIVERTLDGRADRLKEYTLGAEALGRGDSFDPRSDPVVRAEASRLRTRLEQYYRTEGRADPLRIALPKGSYVPQFVPWIPTLDETADAPRTLRSRVVRWGTRPLIAWMCTVLALAVAAAAWLRVPAGPGTQPLAQFEVELSSGGELASDVGTTVVLTPDGTRIVFVSRTADGRTYLNTRRLDQSDAVRLAGTDGARGPFVSPDGRWVGFWADGKVKKMPLDGGSPVVLCDAADLLGASWGEDDTIIAALGDPAKLWRIPSAGGAREVAMDLPGERTLLRWPQILPGGSFVIYTAMTGTGADRATVEVRSLRGGERKVLVQGGTFGRYLPDGYLTYVNQGTLYAVRFDVAARTVEGAPVPILNNVAYSPLFGYAQADASQTGMLVYRKGADSERSVIDWIDRTGNRTSLISAPARYGWLRLSPDGQRLAFTTNDSGIATISIFDINDGETRRITTRPGDYTGLTWLQDGLVAFGGATGLGWVRSTAAGDTSALINAGTTQTPWSATRDGRRLAYYERHPETGFDVWTAPILGAENGVRLGPPEPFLRTRAFELYPSFSPDGRWIVYASNESGPWEVYVRRFPDNGTRVRVSTSGGVVPHWSPNRRELLYRTDAQQLMVVPYKVERDRFVAGAPQAWSEHVLADTSVLPNFDVAPGGERVVALMPATPAQDQQTAGHSTFILHFGDEVRRRVGSR